MVVREKPLRIILIRGQNNSRYSLSNEVKNPFRVEVKLLMVLKQLLRASQRGGSQGNRSLRCPRASRLKSCGDVPNQLR